jgi:hypothetical protein
MTHYCAVQIQAYTNNTLPVYSEHLSCVIIFQFASQWSHKTGLNVSTGVVYDCETLLKVA